MVRRVIRVAASRSQHAVRAYPMKSRNRKRSRKSTIIYWSIMALLFVILLGCGIYIYNDYMERQNGEAETEALRNTVVIQPTAGETAKEQQELKEGFDANLLRRIDFGKLQSVNTDIQRWLFVPNTKIDEPVVNEPVPGRFFYDLRGWNKRYNGFGNFLVPKAPKDDKGREVDDGHTLILGHRMHSMNGEWQFSNLPIRWGNIQGANQFPYVYIYYPDRAERWTVWEALDILGTDEMYNLPIPFGSDRYGEMLNHIQQFARYRRDVGINVDKNVRTVMLSTCNYVGESNKLRRFALVLVPDATYYYKNKKYEDFSDTVKYNQWKSSIDKAQNLYKAQKGDE